MSYLDVPRIHFSGLFYTAPGNLNNLVANYGPARTAKEDLDYDTGLYKYPDGVAQFYLSHCAITSVVGADGVLSSDPERDSLVGATVTSPGPETPKHVRGDENALYGLAKMVDLDPNMMFRTELYAFRVYVDLPGGGGFSGELAAPPQMRDLWFGRSNAGDAGLQRAVGTWHQRLTGLVWDDAAGRSPVYDALRERSKDGLDIKIGVDMYQTRRGDEFSKGNRFGYGRLVGAIGPSSADEPAQLVPGRRLYTSRTFQKQLASDPEEQAGIAFTREASEEAMSEVEKSDWNRTDFRVCRLQSDRSVLIVDLFNSAPLLDGGKGKFDTGGEIIVGLLDGTPPAFEPLKNGRIAFSYSQPDPAGGGLKDAWLPDHSAIFQIELTGDEPEKIRGTQVAIQAGGKTVVYENPNGVYVNIERASIRLEPKDSATFDVYSYRYGQPADLPEPPAIAAMLWVDALKTMTRTEIFEAAWVPVVPPVRGRLALTIKTLEARKPLTKLREPLDSFLCFVTAKGSGYLVGEAMTLANPGAPHTPPFLSLLFWQNQLVPAVLPKTWQEHWEKNIQPILRMYARLFPGMASILDISDLATVRAKAEVLKDRLERDRKNPGYMPVTRDLSPATAQMVVDFLDSLPKEKP